jgi:hypothetical protein
MQATQDVYSIGQLLRDTSSDCGDPEFRHRTRGYHMQSFRYALDRIAYNAFPQTVRADVDISSGQMQYDIPASVFNIRRVYAYNGDCGKPEGAVKLWWKRNFYNEPGGGAYTADRRDASQTGTADPIVPQGTNANGLHWYNVTENGLLMISDSCAPFTHLRIVANGAYGGVDELPCIPRPFAQYIMDSARKRFFTSMMPEELRKYKPLKDDAEYELHNSKTGSYWEAVKRARQADTGRIDDLFYYFEGGKW